MNTETGGPAFPADGAHGNYEGMTLRDYFAAKAMPLAMEEYRMVISRESECLDIEWDKKHGLSSVAARAYELADAMLEAGKL